MTERFSDRQGYRPSPAQITVREDAPSQVARRDFLDCRGRRHEAVLHATSDLRSPAGTFRRGKLVRVSERPA